MQTNKSSFRTLFRRFTTGVAVVGIHGGHEIRGATVNSLTAVSLEPLLLLFCIGSQSRSAAMLHKAAGFSVNLLTSDQVNVSRYYAGGECENRDWRWLESEYGPILEAANASFVCKLDRIVEAGDHDIVIGEVVALSGPNDPLTPLLYHGGQYAELAYSEVGQESEDDSSDFWWTG